MLPLDYYARCLLLLFALRAYYDAARYFIIIDAITLCLHACHICYYYYFDAISLFAVFTLLIFLRC